MLPSARPSIRLVIAPFVYPVSSLAYLDSLFTHPILASLSVGSLARSLARSPTSIPVEPYDVDFIKVVKSERDCSGGFNEFQGRDAFAESLATAIKKNIDDREERPGMRGQAYCYSTAGGTGKTRGMLELKKTLPDLLKDDNRIGEVYFGYAGFNTGLPLSDEEKEYIQHDSSRAERVLARRMLGSVVTSGENKGVATLLPSYKDLYEGRDIPPVSRSINQLMSYLQEERKIDENKITVVIIGVDEVQKLDEVKLSVGKDDEFGLGRYFLRQLRSRQNDNFEKKILFVPVATGVLMKFETDSCDGDNIILSSDNGEDGTVLIKKEAFRELVMEKICADGNVPENEKTILADSVTSLMWPRIRPLETWSVSSALKLVTDEDSNSRSWKEWILRWMVDASFNLSEKKFLPGFGGSIMTAVFTLSDAGTFKVIPTADMLNFMMGVLIEDAQNKSADGLESLYGQLLNLAGLLPGGIIGSRILMDENEFERFGFSVAASSLYLGLEAIAAEDLRRNAVVSFCESLTGTGSERRDACNKRLPLALWAMAHLPEDWELRYPKLFVPKRNMSLVPFQTSGSTFTVEFVEDLIDAHTCGRPIFILSGKKAPCDYLFLIPLPVSVSGDKEWIAFIGDAKHTSDERAPNMDTAYQTKLLINCVSVNNAMEAAGMKITAACPFFVTTMSELAVPNTPSADEMKKATTTLETKLITLETSLTQELAKQADANKTKEIKEKYKKKEEQIREKNKSPKERLDEAKAEFERIFGVSPVLLLSPNSFEFVPFTDILFIGSVRP